MTIPDAKPRLMAQLRTDLPIILLEGAEITNKAIDNVTSQMGPDWQYWMEYPASHRRALPVGEQRDTGELELAEVE